MINFEYKEIELAVLLDGADSKTMTKFSCVWERQSGDCVIVVVDDNYILCKRSVKDVQMTDMPDRILPALKEVAICTLPDIQAIGYFPLAGDKSGVHKVMECIKKWLNEVKTSKTRVYFLVDVLSAIGSVESCQITKEWLENNGYPPEHTRNFTRSGGDGLERLDKKIHFVKLDEYLHIRDHNEISPKLKDFLGIKLHEDEIISEVIKFYVQAWEASWTVKGWGHDQFDNKDSEQLRVLANWLNVPICDLCGESAKSLMIWLGSQPWGKVRAIHGNVLKAVMKKLEIPLSRTHPIPDDGIPMPCSPCFPFLVSLRSFLLCCQEKGAPVSEIRFIDEDEKYRFRLMMKLEDAKKFENRFRKTMDTYGKNPSVEHTFTQPLRYLIYCKTDGLKDNRTYLRLFTDGTEGPVVTVEITSHYIDLIW